MTPKSLIGVFIIGLALNFRLFDAAGIAAELETAKEKEARFAESLVRKQLSTRNISYRLRGESFIPAGYLAPRPSEEDGFPPRTPPQPAKDSTIEFKLTVVIDTTGGRARRVHDGAVYAVYALDFHKEWHVDLFDGKEFIFFQPRARNTSAVYTPAPEQPDVRLYGKTYIRRFIEQQEDPIFYPIGFIPLRRTPIDFKTLRVPQDLHPKYLRTSKLNGLDYDIFEIPDASGTSAASQELWADPAKNYFIGRVVQFTGGKEVCRTEITLQRWKDRWFPAEWTFVEVPRGAKELRHRIKVEDVQIDQDIADSEFTVPLLPGTVVRDMKDGHRESNYVIGAQGEKREL